MMAQCTATLVLVPATPMPICCCGFQPCLLSSARCWASSQPTLRAPLDLHLSVQRLTRTAQLQTEPFQQQRYGRAITSAKAELQCAQLRLELFDNRQQLVQQWRQTLLWQIASLNAELSAFVRVFGVPQKLTQPAQSTQPTQPPPPQSSQQLPALLPQAADATTIDDSHSAATSFHPTVNCHASASRASLVSAPTRLIPRSLCSLLLPASGY